MCNTNTHWLESHVSPQIKFVYSFSFITQYVSVCVCTYAVCLLCVFHAVGFPPSSKESEERAQPDH